jgi:hypothetical protein
VTDVAGRAQQLRDEATKQDKLRPTAVVVDYADESLLRSSARSPTARGLVRHA